MMKKIIYILVAVFFGLGLQAQQMLQSTPIQNLQHIWNPAFTAPGTDLEIAGFFRKQWVGFEGAPSTAVVSLQYPFVDMNMSAGGMIIADWTGPVGKTGIQANYAYKVKELLNRDDQLVLGINGYFHQYRFDGTGVKLNAIDDPIVVGKQSKFVPSFGAGIAYFSGTEEFSSDNLFYVGFSTLQLLESDVLLETGNAKRARHYFVNMGTKLFGYEYFLEPSFQVNYVNPELINFVIGVKYEMEESFWAGLSFSSVNEFGINGGVILDDIAGRHTRLRLGAMAGMNSGAIAAVGPSFEFFASYTFDMD